ncbi:REP-associated tyrosine transposase [Anabaena azotica]|uniref:Transposase n=1 Tax=Anabaena azotica FACHB-119 TaxID=947527 RepID=A0ABR8CY58_9NOST|nr:transposase [Anabaena azotica]MBD2499818.1 transposase [Anabaena azotica FACHB-119]
MSNYRRAIASGSTFFFTQVTYQRIPWLCSDIARENLRKSMRRVQQLYPFSIEAIALLPEHIHCIWTLPENDSNYAIRWRLIKSFVTQSCAEQLNITAEMSESRQKRQEGNLWQRRYWEHLIRDEKDFANHCDYIHYNPVKHGLCQSPKEWQYSSFHRFVKQGIYPADWGSIQIPNIPDNIGSE